MPFIIASKAIKYLVVNLTKEMMCYTYIYAHAYVICYTYAHTYVFSIMWLSFFFYSLDFEMSWSDSTSNFGIYSSVDSLLASIRLMLYCS